MTTPPSVALSGGILGKRTLIQERMTPEQYQYLRMVGAWMGGLIEPEESDGLWYLELLAQEAVKNTLVWSNWEQNCGFIYQNRHQTPDYALLLDWNDGQVTIEGQGRHQDSPATPFKGAKTGRNDPCPCGSDTKYKKCCGR